MNNPGFKLLFLDDRWIDGMEDVKRTLHQPEKYSDYPVLAGSYAWENAFVQARKGPQWIPDEKVWKIWYNARGKAAAKTSGGVEEADPGSSVCLAVSRDLINWEKPFTRVISYLGYRENNIVGKSFWGGPIYDGNDLDPQRRYKAMYNRYVNEKMSWHPIFSSDGIHWSEPLENGVPASDEVQLLYDELSGEYRFYCKVFLPKDIETRLVRGRPIQPNNHRCVGLSVSRDFMEWTTPELVFHADEIDQEICARRNRAAKADPNRLYPVSDYDNPEQYYTDIYNMAVFNYEGLYIGMPCMFNQTGTCANNSAGMLYPELACSRDGRRWERVCDREVFLPLGPKEDFDSGAILMASNPVIGENQIWFYYIGGPETHDRGENRVSRVNTGVGLAKLRLDGFVSVDAGSNPGFLTTKSLEISGADLWLNLDATGGDMRAEILDEKTGKPLAGFSMKDSIPLIGDNISVKLQWKGQTDSTGLGGRKVQIRLVMKHAKLYSIRIGDE